MFPSSSAATRLSRTASSRRSDIERWRSRRRSSAWLATEVFLAKNGVELDPDDDDAYELVIAVAAGEVDDVREIAAALSS